MFAELFTLCFRECLAPCISGIDILSLAAIATMAQRNVSIKNLAEVIAARAALPEKFRPTKRPNGRWHMAKWSSLRVARERRRTLLRGEPWPHVVPHKEVVKRVPFKGHKRDARKLERAAEVERCMARMPEIVADYRLARATARAEKRKAKHGLLDAINQPRDRLEGIVTKDLSSKGGKGKKKKASV